jgi:hypothetical protein
VAIRGHCNTIIHAVSKVIHIVVTTLQRETILISGAYKKRLTIVSSMRSKKNGGNRSRPGVHQRTIMSPNGTTAKAPWIPPGSRMQVVRRNAPGFDITNEVDSRSFDGAERSRVDLLSTKNSC